MTLSCEAAADESGLLPWIAGGAVPEAGAAIHRVRAAAARHPQRAVEEKRRAGQVAQRSTGPSAACSIRLPYEPWQYVEARCRCLSCLWQAFFLGALSRAIATVLIFPCIRVKKIVMSAQQDDAAIKEEVEPETVCPSPSENRCNWLGILASRSQLWCALGSWWQETASWVR